MPKTGENRIFRRFTTAWSWMLPLAVLVPEVVSLAVTDVRLLSDSSSSQYIFHGEGATLSCIYELQEGEVVTAVRWDKDGKEVYVWRAGRPPMAKDVLKARVNTTNNSPTSIVILNATKDMQGTYTCKVQAKNQKSAHNEIYVMVIIDACKENVWETHTDMITCTETISMRCVGMFPKPIPSCGTFDELTGKYLDTVPFDRVQQLKNGTYEISLTRRYDVRNYLNYTDITFRCYILADRSSWRTGFLHRLFGDKGCSQEPPIVEGSLFTMTEEKNCWKKPREGSRVTYNCTNGNQILGPQTLLCRNGSWVPADVTTDRSLPTCSSATTLEKSLWIIVLLLTLIKMVSV